MYSQNNEEEVILNYFKDKKGVLLDIGANDGKTLSNSLALIEQGWKGVLVEPSEKAFNALINTHEFNKNIDCINVAIAEEDGVLEFFESGSHLKNGDHALLSTLKESELKRWEGSDNEFTKTKVECMTIDSLFELVDNKQFDFINIDAEGVDIVILKQIDLSETSLVCIEVNGNQDNIREVKSYCTKFGIEKLLLLNQENIILGR